jgi:DNA-binding transcriptional ArsR family regulator
LTNGLWPSYGPPAIDRFVSLPTPDYDVDDILVVERADQLRALTGDARLQIVAILREGAASASELAGTIGLAKGTVAYHLKVLERAGLVHVVRTRRVRALTESIYGRTARLFLLKGAEDDESAGRVRVRLLPADALRFARRIERLRRDFLAHAAEEGDEYELVAGLNTGGSTR